MTQVTEQLENCTNSSRRALTPVHTSETTAHAHPNVSKQLSQCTTTKQCVDRLAKLSQTPCDFSFNNLFLLKEKSQGVTDFATLVDLILREQLLQSCCDKLVTFIKETGSKTVKEMVDVAERWREVHVKENAARSGLTDPLLAGLGLNRPSGSTPSKTTAPGSNTKVIVDNQIRPQGQNAYNRGRGSRRPYGGRGENRCYWCDQTGHYISDCPKKSRGQPHTASVGMSVSNPLPARVQTCSGLVNGTQALIMLDSGCTTVGVRRDLVRPDQVLDEHMSVMLFDGQTVSLPLALINLDCPYFTGTVKACIVENSVCDVILGRIPGATFECTDLAGAALTRAQAKQTDRPFRPLLTAKTPQLDVTPDSLQHLQRDDKTLQPCFDKVGKKKDGDKSDDSFVLRDGLLYRFRPSWKGEAVWQLVVPTGLRESVLIAAHDGLFGGHMAANSTFNRIAPYFYWVGFRRDVKDYCTTCDVCQKTYPKGKVRPAPLQSVPMIDVPFSRVAVDIIGPITPRSERGHAYVLTCVDVATRYPEAIPLKTITAESVADALIQIFSRVGIPDEILSDQGTQFTADTMREVLRLLSVSQLHSTPYHPQTNGLVERFNGTLKTMLKRLMTDRPKDWDRYLTGALFAYREIPQASTGFAPFELLFGRVPRGPAQLLYESWSGQTDNSPAQAVSDYVSTLKQSLTEMVDLAQKSVRDAADRQKDLKFKAPLRTLPVGSKALILLPMDANKMLLRWKGPFPVLKKMGNCNYLLDMGNGGEKIFHINLLREYLERPQTVVLADIAVVRDQDTDSTSDFDVSKVRLGLVPTCQTETKDDIVYDSLLSDGSKSAAQRVFAKHSHMLTDLPGHTDLVEHVVRLTEDRPVSVRQYPLPFESEETIRSEVRKMLDMGIIEPSSSPFSSPVVLVKKKDNTVRFCIDFRQLNKVTQFDCEPIPDPEVLFTSLRDKGFFTKIDLSKGYWQIPMSENDKQKTAFRTPEGLYHFLRMPFGLSTAPSTFARMMRKLDLQRFSALSFFDDILVATHTWSQNLQALDNLLAQLHKHGLTARPKKIECGFQTIEFLGHIVGNNIMRPEKGKVSKILSVSVPQTKRQVRAFLGLVGFYRRYIPDFATLTAPLTDLTKKLCPSKVRWTPECQRCFDALKNCLSHEPIVVLPDFAMPFTVRCDASSTGIGAVLLQQQPGGDGGLHPVLYASRKLLDRETRYSTVERECLAVIWAVDKFHRYIFGRHFVIETDHRPLTLLKNPNQSNSRLLRWSLALQDYDYSVWPISGSVNFEADVLSRLA